jgi:hypothetical protein
MNDLDNCCGNRAIYHDSLLRNDENIISSVFITHNVFDGYLEKWNCIAIPKVKT